MADTVERQRQFYLFAHEVVIETITRLENTVDPFDIDGLVLGLELLNRSLVNMTQNQQNNIVISMLQEAINTFEYQRESLVAHVSEPGQTDVEVLTDSTSSENRVRGRPCFEITQEQLSSLIEQGFKVPIIGYR